VSGEAEKGIVRRGSGEYVLEITDMGRLRKVAEACTRCELHNTRTHVVFSDGNPDAELMCVGEAPGANEDRTGLPFVGRAGKLLDRLLLSVGFPRAEVFICNVLKCRPPGNRNPLPGEIESCSPFLRRQVELVRPTVIVTFGTFAAQTLLGVRDSLRHLRGRTHLYEGVPLVVTYHPAALLRNPGWTRPTWLDLQLARRIADGDQGQLAARGPEKEHSRPESSDGHEAAADQLTLEGRDA
jgi:DNA polymerase